MPLVNRHLEVAQGLIMEGSSQDDVDSSQTDSIIDDIPTPECNEEECSPEREREVSRYNEHDSQPA